MKKLAVTLAVAMAIAISISLTGCGSDTTKSPLLTYVARASSDSYAPHLFTLDENTQKSTAVAISIPVDAQYVSANSDATAVTYCYDGTDGYDIFLMGTDSKEKQLTTGAYACESVFSPDGKTIAYVSVPSGGSPGIYTMNVDGSNQKALYTPAANTTYAYMPEFSPDGKSLVFYVYSETSDVAGQKQRTRGARTSSWLHALNGRSKTAVHSAEQPLITTPSDGWYKMALTDATPTLVYATTTYAWGPAVYSTDGKKLLMTIDDGTEYNISSVNLDGTGLTPLTTGTDTASISPVPYKNLILFNRTNDANSSWDIYVMDQTGANQVLVSSTANTFETLIDTYLMDY